MDARGVGHLAIAIAIDVGASRSAPEFESDVGRLSDAVHALQPRPGIASVLMPGEPEDESTRRFVLDGLTISTETCRSLAKIAGELDLEPPAQITESARGAS